MICTNCGEDRPEAARGLCRTCYSRWQRTGSFDRTNQVREGAICSVEGCTNRVHGQGLCNKHLLRLRRTGTIAPGRAYPEKQNKPTQHELYPQWYEFQRPKNLRPVVPEWKTDFAQFALDVGGVRPSRRHRLYPIDKSKPMGPGNFEWREALIEKLPGEDQLAYNKRHRAAHRAEYPRAYKDSNLRRNFGPDYGFSGFADKFEAQNGVCAISGAPESARTKKGVLRDLCTDHSHVTDEIRQLLTSAMNTMIGMAEDNPMLLAKGILYVAKHNPAGPEAGQVAVDQAIAYLQRHPVASLDRSAILPQD